MLFNESREFPSVNATQNRTAGFLWLNYSNVTNDSRVIMTNQSRVKSVNVYQIFPELNKNVSAANKVEEANDDSNNRGDETGFILITASNTTDDLNVTIADIKHSNVTANISQHVINNREKRQISDVEEIVHVARYDDDNILSLEQSRNIKMQRSYGHSLLAVLLLVPLIVMILYLTTILVKMINKTKKQAVNLESGESQLSQIVISQKYYERCPCFNDECQVSAAANISDMSCHFDSEKSESVPRKRSLDKNRKHPQLH